MHIKRYTHRDGWEGSSKEALYAEVIPGVRGACMVFPDGRRMKCEHISRDNVEYFVSMGWWIEITTQNKGA